MENIRFATFPIKKFPLLSPRIKIDKKGKAKAEVVQGGVMAKGKSNTIEQQGEGGGGPMTSGRAMIFPL